MERKLKAAEVAVLDASIDAMEVANQGIAIAKAAAQLSLGAYRKQLAKIANTTGHDLETHTFDYMAERGTLKIEPIEADKDVPKKKDEEASTSDDSEPSEEDTV
jgi:hypothetical protein